MLRYDFGMVLHVDEIERRMPIGVRLSGNFLPLARDDLLAIRGRIAATIRGGGARHVPHHPDRDDSRTLSPDGGAGQAHGARECTSAGLPYLIVCARATATDVDVLTVLHSRRRYPGG